MKITRRSFCAGTLMSGATLWLPACGGGAFDTEAPAQWAQIAFRAVASAPPPGFPPYLSGRVYAMAFLAAHDALNAIRPAYATYFPARRAPGADPDAAVATAMHDVLVHELPFAQAMLDSEYAGSLAAVADDEHHAKARGVAIGQACAAAMLAARADDGLANIQTPYVQGTKAGEYRFTPPFDFADAVNLGSAMRPFAIANPASYLVERPYAITDAAYTADYKEVKAIGSAASTVRTADQTEIALFWREFLDSGWSRIAIQLAAAHDMPGWALMRALALVVVAQVDSFQAGFESKYFYRRWRPITAIRLGDEDGNDDTVGDPGWISLDPVCPPAPDYPSTHSVGAGAGEAVLARIFHRDGARFTHQSDTLPGVTRSFTSFSQAAQEICNSRVYVGYHFRLATTVGRAQGRRVGTDIVQRLLLPRFQEPDAI
jgi:hypothetical protein